MKKSDFTPLQRLVGSIRVNDNGCWVSDLGTDDPKAYVTIKIDGKRIRGHRLMYETQVGEIADGLVVCHTCDNPKCINPKHLFVGTVMENVKDMLAKGRGHGDSTDLASRICATALEHPGKPRQEIATELGCNYSTVIEVLKRNGLQEAGPKQGVSEAKVLELLTEDPERSDASIAEELNITAGVVAKKRLKNGIRRPVQEKKPRPVKVPQKRLPRDKICAIATADPSKTAQAIADEVECNYYSVLEVLKKAGLRSTTPRIPSAVLNKVCEIVKADPSRTNESIAKELGISVKAVENKLSRRGNKREELTGEKA